MRHLALLAVTSMCFAQPSGDILWAPKPKTLTKYTAPHKPHTKLADLKAKHAGKAEWRELIVDDEHLRSEYIFAKEGTAWPKRLHPDTRAWWVIVEGEVAFHLESQSAFVAKKGSMVQVPMQTIYSMRAEKPSLIFETHIAGAKTLYPKAVEPPEAPAGWDWKPVSLVRTPGVFLRNNKAHTTFEELAEKLESGKLKGTQKVVEDDRGAANFIYGYEKNLPPIDPKAKGHYHPEGAEYWLIMKGQIRYPIEGQGVIIANEGDVVYVPKFTFHLPRWYGPGPSCRLAMNGFPNIAHLFEAPQN